MGLFSGKIKISEAGLFNGLIDYHCHILPGVDDGFKTMEDSILALEAYAEAGIAEVWFTPHVMEDIPNRPEGLKLRFEELCRVCKSPIKLNLSSEYMLDGLFKKRIADNEILPLMESSLLVETSYFNPPIDLDEMLGSIKSRGLTPVMAHPERYMYMDKEKYESLLENNVKFQLNIGSLLGYYGPQVKSKSEWLLKHNLYSYIGTDLHSLRTFENFLSEKIAEKTIALLPR